MSRKTANFRLGANRSGSDRLPCGMYGLMNKSLRRVADTAVSTQPAQRRRGWSVSNDAPLSTPKPQKTEFRPLPALGRESATLNAALSGWWK